MEINTSRIFESVSTTLICAVFLGGIHSYFTFGARLASIEQNVSDIKIYLNGKTLVKVKRGASLHGCSAEILNAAIDIESIFTSRGVEFVITEGIPTLKHAALHSAHYRGDAVDIRSKPLKTLARKKAVLIAIKRKLGRGFVVILESLGKRNEHYHVHWAPIYETTNF